MISEQIIIEAYVIAYLDDLGYRVYGEVPKSTEGEFVTVERTGAGWKNQIDSATLAVQAWADTMLEAATLADAVAEDLRSMIGEDEISSVSVTGPYNYTDPRTNKYRYQAAVYVVYYKE